MYATMPEKCALWQPSVLRFQRLVERSQRTECKMIACNTALVLKLDATVLLDKLSPVVFSVRLILRPLTSTNTTLSRISASTCTCSPLRCTTLSSAFDGAQFSVESFFCCPIVSCSDSVLCIRSSIRAYACSASDNRRVFVCATLGFVAGSVRVGVVAS
jgi:hypothetical protein